MRKEIGVYTLFIISLFFFIFWKAGHTFLDSGRGSSLSKEMAAASETMRRAMDVVRHCREEKGILIDKRSDPNLTGLIGQESSSITTSLGNLEAKRTTTNPNFAGLVVFLLKEAGVRGGDAVAVGASSSFPALIIAVLSACRALEIHPLLINSLGASQWGANIPEFHWLDMQDCLLEASWGKIVPAALSLGGDEDAGKDMSPEGRSLLAEDIREREIFFIKETSLERNVRERMRLYEDTASGKEIKAFINIGGSWANMGVDSEVLRVEPGLSFIERIPPSGPRGVIYEMASRRVPVIHLLNIKGLCQRCGLPWDPFPLPLPGEGRIYALTRKESWKYLLFVGVYFLAIVGIIALYKRSEHLKK